MKSTFTLATVALIAIAGAATANAAEECAASQAANAAIIARAQAAATPAARLAIVKAAIKANPANAACLTDLALQMTLSSNVNPAAGPEEFAPGEVPTTTNGFVPPAENPNQLNQSDDTQASSPASPSFR